MKKIFTFISIICSVVFAQAQPFIDAEKTVFEKPIWCAGLKAIDVDKDGDLDVVIFGESANSGSDAVFTILDPVAQMERAWAPNKGAAIWLNSGNKIFSEGTLPVAGFWQSVLYPTDWDGNNDIDLVAGRWDPNGTVFLINSGNGTFTKGPDFTAFSAGDARDIQTADFNNDGNLDLVETNNGNNCNVYFLDKDKAVKSKFNLELTEGLWDPSSAVFDFNKDGRNDIYITGGSQSGGPVVGQIFYNNGDETFTVQKQATGKWFGGVHTGDFDGDGIFDLVMAGRGDYGDGEGVAYVYKGSANGFVEFQKVKPGWMNDHFSTVVKFVDYNNDGKLEIIFSGNIGASNQLAGYKLNADGSAFVEDFTLDGYFHSSIECADLNADGKVDIILSGEKGEAATDRFVKLYWNQTAATNAAPAAPTNLRAKYSASESKFIFEWDAAADDHTPSKGLTYNLYVVDKTTGKYLYSPMADTITGYRKVGDHGNVGNNLSWKLNLPDGDYTWSVQSIDAAFAGSAFPHAKLVNKTATSVSSLATEKIEVYPNPVLDQLSITSKSALKQIDIYSIEGKLIRSETSNNASVKMNVASLQSGIYLVRLTGANNTIHVSRFVKR
jgi:hypothetical protein